MKPIILLAISALCWAAPPTIRDGPTIQSQGANFATVKWVTTDAAGPSSTATAGVDDSTTTIPAAECANFPDGAVIKIGYEHMEVVSRSASSGACNLTVRRGYDPQFLRKWENTLTSIVVSGGNLGTVTTPMDHYYVVGDTFRVLRINGTPIPTGTTYTVASVPTSPTFTFTCSGCTNGIYTNAGMQVYKYATSHSNGDTITRIDSDAALCIGTVNGGPYTTYTGFSTDNTRSDIKQSVNHYVYSPALPAATTLYAKVMSTPRTGTTSTNATPSSCASPGSDTVVSSQFTITTDAAGTGLPTAPSTAGKDWAYQTAGLTFSTDVTAASDCSDIQTKINTAAAADGSLNHRIKIPAAAACNVNLTLPAKSGGTGKLVLSTEDYASLPAEGVRIDSTYASHMPTLRTATASPVILIDPSASYWVVRGLKITVDPAVADFGGDGVLVSSFTGGDADYDTTQDPDHIVFQQNWITCPEYNNDCKGVRIHGSYLVAEANDIGPTYGSADLGAFQVDGYASQYIYVHNNKLSGVMTGYYQSDNALNPADTWVNTNYMVKPKSWQSTAWQSLFSANQGVATATASASPTAMTTTYNSSITTGTPLAFSGATGNWTPLNYTRWGLVEGTLASLVCSSGSCTAITSTAHGLATGQRIYIGGGYAYPCLTANTPGYSVTVTVTNSTTFTYSNNSSTFSTVSGANWCQGSEISIIGPVWYPTTTGANSYTIPLNSTGFGALTGTVTVSYPLSRNVKNALEFKTGIRADISGNTVDGSYAEAQSGQLSVMSVRGSDMFGGWPLMQGAAQYCWNCGVTITDVNIHDNFFSNGCTMSNVLGLNANGPVTPMQRVEWQNNLATGVSLAQAGSGTCLSSPMSWSSGQNQVTMLNNTVPVGTTGRLIDASENQTGPITLSGNIWPGFSPISNGSCKWGGMVIGYGCSGTASFFSWTVGRNIFWGSKAGAASADPWNYDRQFMSGVTDGVEADYTGSYWPELVSSVVWTGQRSISGCTNATPIVCTTTTAHGLATGDQVWIDGDTGNTQANLRWFVRVTSSTEFVLVGSIGNGTSAGTRSMTPVAGTAATVAAFTLAAGSPYLAGTTFVAPDPPPSYGSAGSGDDGSGGSVGIDPVALAAALAGETPAITTTQRFSGAARVSGAVR